MLTVPRRAHDHILDLLQDEPALLVQGPRGAGKTTILRQIGASAGTPVIDVSALGTREVAQADPVGFLQAMDFPILIDEYQAVPALLHAIKDLVDQERRPGLVVLSGSTTEDLLPRGTETLTGRIHRLAVWGFSQGERRGLTERFLEQAFSDPQSFRSRPASACTRADLAYAAVVGSFPEAIRRERPDARRRWQRSYLDRVVERDLSLLVRVNQPALLSAVLHSCVHRTAQVLNASDIANDLQANLDTVQRYLRLLERTFLIQRLPAYHRNRVTRLARHPKLHLTDVGLAASLARFDERSLLLNTWFGPVLETFVVGELTKQASWLDSPISLHHFRTHDGSEVDVVLEADDGRVVGIEVKSSVSVSQKDLRGLRRLADVCGDDFLHGFVLYTGPTSIQLGPDPRFSAIPVASLWETGSPIVS